MVPSKRRKRKPQTGSKKAAFPSVSRRSKRRAHGFVAAYGSRAQSALQEVDSSEGVRLNRWLAERGIASRRKADELIAEGHVEVNGVEVEQLGYRVRPGDEVRVKGEIVKEVPRLYYLFYKPKGVLCTESTRESRTRVSDLVAPMVPSRVFTVGRLDEDSEGLLLLTNDGDFAQLIAHPRHGVPKTYVVQLQGAISSTHVDQLRNGIHLAEGKVVPSRVRVMRRSKNFSTVEVEIREGKNREVRRMFSRVGYRVRSLKRVRIGRLGVKGIPRGGLRPLTRAERDSLAQLAHAKTSDSKNEASDRSAPPKARNRSNSRKRY